MSERENARLIELETSLHELKSPPHWDVAKLLQLGEARNLQASQVLAKKKTCLREACTALKGKRTWTENLNDSSTTISIKHLQETLERTLSSSDIGLLLLYLKENGAIKGEEIDAQMFQVAVKELFGDGALIFFELLDDISRQNEIK